MAQADRAEAIVSIIIPVLNEAANVRRLGKQLVAETGFEVIVVDAGSRDGSAKLAASLGYRVVNAPRGRSVQMNAGAAVARGKLLWFVHADTGFLQPVDNYLAAIGTAPGWGFFPVRLSGRALIFRIIERAISWRSRLTGVASGDQGIFISRELFTSIGGFPHIALMEDIALSKLLRRRSAPLVPPLLLLTSSRRWEQRGVLATVLLMWRLRFSYWRGVAPDVLARKYQGRRDDD